LPPESFVSGREPCVREAPASVDAAKPIPAAPPPLTKRPSWNEAMIVEPKADAPGSTSVACWLATSLNRKRKSEISSNQSVHASRGTPFMG
jgi:hypothetical protein